MSDLKSIPAIRVGGEELSLHDVFHSLHVRGRLRRFLRGPVTEKVVLDAAHRDGLSVSDEELQKAVDAFRTANGLNKAAATHRWLKRNRLTQEDLESRIESDLLHRQLMQKIASPDEIKKYFAANRTRFDHVRLARIVVKDEGLASELLAQIRDEGADFAALARQHSLDLRGRRLGPRIVARNRLPASLEQAVFAARAGEVVGPLKVGNTWHLLRIEAFLPGQLTPRTATLIRRMLYRRWLRKQAESAKIEVRLPSSL